MLNRGSQVRGPSTLGWVICKCHSGGVLRQPTGRGGGRKGWGMEGRQEGRRRRVGAVVVFSHVDYSTTDADTLLPFVRINSGGYFGLCVKRIVGQYTRPLLRYHYILVKTSVLSIDLKELTESRYHQRC